MRNLSRRMFPLLHLLDAGVAVLVGVAALVLGVAVATQIRIADLAADTRDNVLPVITARHEISHDLERLILFGEELLSSDDPAKRRLARLSAQTLVYNEPWFRSDPEIQEIGIRTLRILTDLTAQRDRRDELNREVIGLLLSIGAGMPVCANPVMPTGDSQKDLLIQAMSADSHSSLDEITRKIGAVRQKEATNLQTGFPAEVDRLIALRRQIVNVNTSSTKTWNEITHELKSVTDTLATKAQLQTSGRFSEIQEQASKVKQVGISGLAFLVGMVSLFARVAHRLLIRPLVQATTSLERVLHGEAFEPSSGSIVTEIGSIIAATSVLCESEERLRAAQNYARIGHWELLRDGQTAFRSEQIYQIFGLPRSSPPGTETLREIVDAGDCPAVIRSFQQSIAIGAEHHIEYRIRRHNDGAERWIECRGKPSIGKDGLCDKLVGFIQDITERKRTEEEICKLNQELEQRVAQRTLQLEAANKELEAFAYSVSHDLRAPLRHVVGFVDLLMKRSARTLDEQSLHYMDTISDAAQRMGTLIDDLLSFSRMGRHEMTRTQVDLGAEVQEAIREFELETKGRAIEWRIGELPLVTGDCAMLRVVLVNLISNALKFTQPRAQAKIEIGCLRDQRAETVVFVRDNGAGFDMQYADKLFGVFQRLHGVDQFEGTGIGLANVRRVISRHGGRTWAEGTVDGGATFYFSLPQTLVAS
jgi:PAS domain S-box-containing protein